MKKMLLVLWVLTIWRPLQGAPMDGAKLQKPLPQNLWVEMAKIVDPAVVGIVVEFSQQRNLRELRRDPLFRFLEEFLGEQPQFQQPPSGSQSAKTHPIGTGFIIRKDGLIITNHHVAEVGKKHKLMVSIPGVKGKEGELIPAKILGSDIRGDITLLKVEGQKSLPFLELGTSQPLQKGQHVAAFGSPYGHANTMTVGVISAMGRELKEINRFPFLQTDASINPGNSGGPLLDTNGYVIGVNTAIDGRAQGIGFAIPIDYVKKVLPALERGETVKRGFLGIDLSWISPRRAYRQGLPPGGGVYVKHVFQGTPAEKGGVLAGDIIVETNSKKIKSLESFIHTVQDTPIASNIKLKVLREQRGRGFRPQILNIKVSEYFEPSAKALPPPTSPPSKKQSLKKGKTYGSTQAPFNLGFGFSDSSSGARKYYDIPLNSPFGPIVTTIVPGSIAQKSGMQVGDILLEINGTNVINSKNSIPLFRRGENKIVCSTKNGSLKTYLLHTS